MEALPRWAQLIAKCLPSTYAFEALRTVFRNEPVAGRTWEILAGLTAVYFVFGIACFVWLFRRARATGHLGRLGQD